MELFDELDKTQRKDVTTHSLRQDMELHTCYLLFIMPLIPKVSPSQTWIFDVVERGAYTFISAILHEFVIYCMITLILWVSRYKLVFSVWLTEDGVDIYISHPQQLQT